MKMDSGNHQKISADVISVLISVHGGSYHKLFHFHEMLQTAGLRSLVFVNQEAPMGLQPGIDFSEEDEARLALQGIYFLSRGEIQKRIEEHPMRLLIVEGHEDREGLPGDLVRLAKERHQALSAQVCWLTDDFNYWDTDYVFVQHPITLWFVLEYYKRPDAFRMTQAKKIYYAGNLFYEPVPNRWTSDLQERGEFIRSYGLDPQLPICLWMPDRDIGKTEAFPRVVEAVKAAPMNLVVKLHPWEYKAVGHSYLSPYGEGKTSADRWSVPAIEERDGSWAMHHADLVIVGHSSAGIEASAWWRKAVFYVAPKDWRVDSVAKCSRRIERLDDLPPLLRKRSRWPRFSAKEFESEKRNLSVPSEMDSFQRHLKAVLEVLELPPEQESFGSLDPIRKLYHGAHDEFQRMQGVGQKRKKGMVSRAIGKIKKIAGKPFRREK